MILREVKTTVQILSKTDHYTKIFQFHISKTMVTFVLQTLPAYNANAGSVNI
jgi:hypothetical protein